MGQSSKHANTLNHCEHHSIASFLPHFGSFHRIAKIQLERSWWHTQITRRAPSSRSSRTPTLVDTIEAFIQFAVTRQRPALEASISSITIGLSSVAGIESRCDTIDTTRKLSSGVFDEIA